MGARLLVVEDDQSTLDYIRKGLTEAGHVVDIAATGQDGLFMASDGKYDAIILDRMLPGLNGLGVLAALRASDIETPVLILSALAEAEERVKGLKAGGDDYLAKPFSFAELEARIEALLRRPKAIGAAETKLACGDLQVDLLSRRALRGSRALELQPREFQLLEFLLRHRDQVVTRTMLLEGVWDYHFDPQTNVVDVHISRLRQKVDQMGEAVLIHTVRGAGYMLSSRSA